MVLFFPNKWEQKRFGRIKTVAIMDCDQEKKVLFLSVRNTDKYERFCNIILEETIMERGFKDIKKFLSRIYSRKQV